MSTRHKMVSTLTMADDSEIEVTIHFLYTKGAPDSYDRLTGWDQGYAAEIELNYCEPAEYEEAARKYLETDNGYQEAFEVATAREDD